MLPAMYRVLTRSLAPLAVVYLNWRRDRGKEHPIRFRERQGVPSMPRPCGPLIWLHAASEVNQRQFLG